MVKFPRVLILKENKMEIKRKGYQEFLEKLVELEQDYEHFVPLEYGKMIYKDIKWLIRHLKLFDRFVGDTWCTITYYQGHIEGLMNELDEELKEEK